jgi:hypothetical protein
VRAAYADNLNRAILFVDFTDQRFNKFSADVERDDVLVVLFAPAGFGGSCGFFGAFFSAFCR